MSSRLKSAFLLLLFLGLGATLPRTQASAQAGPTLSQEQHRCIRTNSDRAYLIAAGLMRERNLDRTDPFKSAVSAARKCIDDAVTSSKGELAGGLRRLRSNLEGLEHLLGTSNAPGNAALKFDKPPSPSRDKIRHTIGFDEDVIRRPISRASVRGAITVMDQYTRWMADVVDSASLQTRRDVRDLRAEFASERLRSDYILLHTEYTLIRAELDRLISDAIPARWRMGLGITGYEGRIVGVGAVGSVRVLGRDALLAGYGLAGRGTDWDLGFELSAGVAVAEVALLPGVVFMEGEPASFSGSVVLVRPGSPMIGVSYSGVQGIGLKMLVGL